MKFKCNECGKIFPVVRMTDDKRMCKDCYIKWLETDFVKMRTEERDKKIKQLEAQVEKMKCPQNCKNGSVYNWSDNSICMDCEKVRTLHEDNWQEMCKGCKYWELEIKENV